MRGLALLVLIVVGGAVFVARSGVHPPAATPTVTTPTAAPKPAAAEQAKPTVRAAAPTPVPTTVKTEARPTATRAVAKAAPTATEPAAKPTGVAAAAANAGTPTPVATAKAPAATPTSGAATPTTQAAATTVATPRATTQPTVLAAQTAAAPNAAAPPRAAGAVALTFDAGADRGYAEDILDTLADEHVVGSFGITGNWARANPDLVRRMAADGHLVFNHTLDHKSFTGLSDSLGGLSAAQRRAELDNADAIIAPLIGHSTRPFYRLPYGDDDAHVAADVAPDGYTRKIGWTVDSEGWRGLQSTDILARCLKLAASGAIYVMHVGRESQDSIALPQVIHQLRDRGFTFVRVDEQ